MMLPPGYAVLSSIVAQNGISDVCYLVCKLRKSIYGLKQSPRCWFHKFSTAIKEFGFIQSHADYSLFTLSKGSKFVAILVYVDDILITGSDQVAVQNTIQYLGTKFKLKDLGLLKYFLGIDVAHSATGVYLHK